MKIVRLVGGIALFALALTLVAVPGQAETTECTVITSVPVVVAAQGVYCLKGNVSTSSGSGYAIEITANNVTIDLNGWKVGGLGAGAATLSTGIYSTANNVTIRNGIVRGFRIGVQLGGRGARIEDVLLDKNTYRAINALGEGAVVRRNQIVSTGGSTANVDAFGIVVTDSGSLIEDNLVSGLNATADGDEWAIYLGAAADYSTVRGNMLSDDLPPPGAGVAIGIRMGNPVHVAVVDNTITHFDLGVYYYGSASGVYSRNTVVGCTTPFTGGTAGSGNASN